MPANEIHVDDVGTNYVVTIKDENDTVVDISGAITRNMIFKKPNGVLLTVPGVLVTDGTDGQLKYTFVSGDLNKYGWWSMQAFIDWGSTEWYSDIVKFRVYPNLDC